ncbi:MAG: integrase arm-type DNA-binding domain-containing protein [Pseudomonadota bacterium]
MALTDIQCKKAKTDRAQQKLTDGFGLYLLVKNNGSKYWHFKYRFLGKEKRLTFGVYPEVSLAEAREKRARARKLVSEDIDPAAARKEKKRLAILNSENTFEAVAKEWHENQLNRWSDGHGDNVMHKLETDIFPYIGKRPIADIDAPELLAVLRKIEQRGALDMAHRARGVCGQIFRYGIATGRCKHDHTADLKEALKTVKTQHFAALDIKEIPAFLQSLESNDARLYARTRRAVRMLMLTFVRTTELIESTWDEFDFEENLWTIPAERMKMRKSHIVPLSRQVLEILKEQKEECGHLNTNFVFPSQIRPIKPMSNNTILFAIKRLGYQGRMTGHGFRALAMSSIKEKLNYRHEVVDRQLAHGHRNKVTAAYDRAQFIDERKVMMQEWADYLDSIADHGKVIFGKFRDAA